MNGREIAQEIVLLCSSMTQHQRECCVFYFYDYLSKEKQKEIKRNLITGVRA